MAKSKRVAFFLRSATGDLVDLKHQLKILKKELIGRGFDPAICQIEVYRDGHQSGLRPGSEFKRMCRDLKGGKIDVVMVTRMNRVSRKLSELFAFYDLIETHTIRFICADECIDSDNWDPTPPKENAKSVFVYPLNIRSIH